MDSIVIEGVRPYDGRYDFDLAGQGFTTREWGWIKRLSGYLPLTLEEGFRGGDPEMFCCFAAIAMRRAGRIQPTEVPDVFARLSDAEFGGSIRLETDTAQEEDEAPVDPSGNSHGNEPSSGNGSPMSSGSSDSRPKPSGMPASVISVSGLERSAT